MVRSNKRKENVYALYNGDRFIDIGTKKELAKKYNWTVSFVSFLGTSVNMKRSNGRRLLVTKIGSTTDDLRGNTNEDI